jgi:hypothetical protein
MKGREITGTAGILPTTQVSFRKSNFITVSYLSVVVPYVSETTVALPQPQPVAVA